MVCKRRVSSHVSRRVEVLERRVLLASTPITIDNASFELLARADGESAGVASWQGASAISVFNPTSSSYTNANDDSLTLGGLPSPANQKQVMVVGASGFIASQTLNTTVEGGGTQYQLIVAVGNRGDQVMDDYRVALFAGNIEIAGAQGSGETAAVNFGFGNVTITSAPIGDDDTGLLGQPLRIELTNLGTASDPDALQVNFDNVRLNKITPDPDTTPPTASITPPVVKAGDAFTDFEVLIADNVGVDSQKIDTSEVTVTSPSGTLPVTLQNTEGTFGAPSATLTFRLAAPGGTWDTADNGPYTINVGGVAFDTSINRVTPAALKFNVNIAPPDTAAPTAALDPVTAPALGAAALQFTVTYTDNVAVAANGGNSNQIRVTGPNGYDQPATFVEQASAQGKSRTLRYSIPAPGGAFGPDDNGTYTVVSTGGNPAIVDTSGNPVAAGNVGTFDLSLGVSAAPGPVPDFGSDQGVPELGADSYRFQVAFFDEDGIDITTFGDNDVLVTGPNGFSQTARLSLSSQQPSSPSAFGIYEIDAPGGTFDPTDNGAYTIALLPTAVADVDGDFAAAGPFNASFQVDFLVPTVGGLDPDFGGGTGLISFDPPGPALKTTDLIALDDGSSIAIGFTNVALNAADITLFRTTADGVLDTTFGGNGNGLVNLDINGGDDRATTVVQLPNGKFLVTGTTSTYDINGVETDADIFVARFNADGTVDGTFGTGGFAVADFGNVSLERGNDLVVLSDGRIVVFGSSTFADPNGDIAVVRFSDAGALDSTFGTNGRVLTDLGGADVANAVVLTPDGGFVAAGSTASGTAGSFAIVRYTAAGVLETGWGPQGDGKLIVDFLPGFDEAQSIVLQDDGMMVAGGLATTGSPNDAGFDSDFAVLRFDTTGNLDQNFGSGGKLQTGFDGLASINKLVIQPGGKVVASGEVVATLGDVGVATVRVAIARYNLDGTLDANFSDDGKLIIDVVAGGVVEGSSNQPLPLLSANAEVGAALTDLEEKFNQFRQDSQGLVAISKGGAILALATQDNNVAIARLIGDGGAPSLFVALIPSIAEIDVTSSTFVVRYVDDLAVDVSLLGTGDIRVTGPNGFNQLAEFVSIEEGATDGAERTVRYRVKPGGTAFLKADEGTYALALEANRVADVNGNFLQAGAIPGATFTVTIPENLPNLAVGGAFTGKFPAAVVGGAKATGGTVQVTNTGVQDAKTTIDVTIFASTDAELDTTADTPIAVINGVKVSLKPGKGKAFKVKFTQFPANLPDGDYFLIARLDNGNTLNELKESDNNAATATPINIAAPFVDLSGTPASLGGALVPGGKVSASALITNSGNIAVKQSVPVQILASPGDATVGNNDVAVATPTAKLNLKPATSKATKLSFVLPATGLAPGTYTLLAVLDSSASVVEKDETNNLVVLGQFTV